jgi:prevent-host-death family protein
MTRRMTASEAKAKILGLLDEVASGEEVEITKHGRTVARLVPATGGPALRASLTGVALTAAPEGDLFGTGEDWDLP